MFKKLLFMLLAFSGFVFAEQCDLSDEDNFPNSECSITSLGANFTQLRFGRIDELNPGSNNGEIILRSGSSVFEINAATEIFREVDADDDDGDDLECASVDIYDQADQEIAYILESDSLDAPRVISRLWILDCEVSQLR